MSSVKVLITEPMPLVHEEVAILKESASVELCSSSDRAVIKRRVADADVMMVVYAKITADILESAKRLKGVVRYGVGVDNVDVEKATELGIMVANVPVYATDAAADHTFALLLALARKIVMADNLMTRRNFSNWTQPSETIRGVELRGKTLGLIGLGHIGAAVAERARSFGMKVVTYDPYLPRDRVEQIGVTFTSLEELLRDSDIISLHTPLSDETRGMINEVTLSKMKKGSFIVNTARGPLIDTRALVAALKNGRVAGAALDVFPQEPPDPNDELLELENVVRTPHIAWYTDESLRRLEMAAVQQTREILSGKVPTNLVNKDVLPKRRT